MRIEVTILALECFSEIEITYPRGRVLVVTHNTLIRVALCQLLGVALSKYRTVFPTIDNGALSELGLENGQASLLRFNLPLNSAAIGSTEVDESGTQLYDIGRASCRERV